MNETNQDPSQAPVQSVVPRLFAATDYTDSMYPDEAWWMGVWAASEEQALSYAKEHYLESDEIESVTIQASYACTGWQPDSWPSEERRDVVLREAGWRCEGEYACEVCDMYACDLAEFDVCQDCCRCAKCAAEESEADKCENCGL